MSNRDAFLGLTDGATNFSLLMAAAAHYVIPAHLMGGLLLMIGFATRAAAIAQLPLLIGAVFYLYLPRFSSLELRQNLEFTSLVLFLLAIFSISGAGRYSCDYLVRKYADRNCIRNRRIDARSESGSGVMGEPKEAEAFQG